MSKLVKAISENGSAALSVLDSTRIVAAMEGYHHPSAVVSAALGRLLTGAALMAAGLKSTRDALTLRVKGGGPAGLLLVVADGAGNVKGYAENPLADLPGRPDGKLDVGGVVGRNGLLTVIRDTGMKEPYIGQVPLVSGEIAEDLTAYYAASEQVPTVCALGVLVEKDLTIRRAGGYLLQLLPGATEEEISLLEHNLAGMASLTSLLDAGKTAADIIGQLLDGFHPQLLDGSTAQYHCDCSLARTERVYRSLGQQELRRIAAEQEIVEIKCQFCNRAYHLRAADYLTAEE